MCANEICAHERAGPVAVCACFDPHWNCLKIAFAEQQEESLRHTSRFSGTLGMALFDQNCVLLRATQKSTGTLLTSAIVGRQKTKATHKSERRKQKASRTAHHRGRICWILLSSFRAEAVCECGFLGCGTQTVFAHMESCCLFAVLCGFWLLSGMTESAGASTTFRLAFTEKNRTQWTFPQAPDRDMM